MSVLGTDLGSRSLDRDDSASLQLPIVVPYF